MNSENILKYLEENLSEYRLKHTLGVAQTAKELAIVYDCDIEKAYSAGLLHDIAKEKSLDEMREIATEYFSDIDDITLSSKALMHSVAGACFSRKFYDIDDEIFDAILYHTTGKADMSLLTKVVYIADYIEPMRDFDGVEEIREFAYKNLDLAIIKSCSKTIIHTVNKGGVVHPNTVNARNYLLMNNRGALENEEK